MIVSCSFGSPALSALRLLGEPLDELVRDRPLDDDPARRHADLALVQERAEGRRVDRVLEIGVGEHDQRVVAAELEHDRLRFRPAASASLRPVSVEPVKLIRRTCGFSTSSSPIGPASPGACVTMFSTPGGQPGLGEDLAPEQPADDRRPARTASARRCCRARAAPRSSARRGSAPRSTARSRRRRRPAGEAPSRTRRCRTG